MKGYTWLKCIYILDEQGIEHIVGNFTSLKSARTAADKKAKEIINNSEKSQVYISAFRATDNKYVYNNRDGWNPVGKAW